MLNEQPPGTYDICKECYVQFHDLTIERREL